MAMSRADIEFLIMQKLNDRDQRVGTILQAGLFSMAEIREAVANINTAVATADQKTEYSHAQT